jgi:hypothetical protein
MKNFLLSIFLISNILGINGIYTQEVKTPEAKEEVREELQQETYVNKEKKYEIQYPKSWQTRATPNQFDLVLIAPPLPGENQISGTMNIISEKIGSAFTLEEFFNENIPNITTELKDAHVEKIGNQSLHGVPSKWALYSHKMNNLTLKVLQYFIVANEHAYLLTFSAIDEEFPAYKKEFEKIAESFRLLVSSPESTLEPQGEKQPLERPSKTEENQLKIEH